MALFGGQRDMSLFTKVNKELINDIIDTEIYYYQVALTETKSNLYGEGKDKVFNQPIKIPALLNVTNHHKFRQAHIDVRYNLDFLETH